MAPRQLPGIGLQGFETLGASGWNTFVDSNWRILSAWTQARVNSFVAAVPTSGVANGDTHILTAAPNANSMAIRDAGAWVYLTPLNGCRVYDEETQLYFTFDGTSWSPENADLTATANGAVLNLRKRGSSAGAQAATEANGSIGLLQFTGWTGSAWKLGAQIIGQAQQLWSGAANGTAIVFQTIANGATTLADRMRLTASALWVDVPITGVAAQRLSVFCAYSGTANAILLTYGQGALAVGQQVRFRALNANTGATTINLDGLGAIACRTVTGVALPSGYIRTGVETVATYDGTFWVVDRQTERGSNANGSWVRYADGRQECWHTGLSDTSTDPSGNIFRSTNESSWTFPVGFLLTDDIVVSASARNAGRWAHGRPGNTLTALIRQYSSVNSTTVVDVNVRAVGTWY